VQNAIIPASDWAAVTLRVIILSARTWGRLGNFTAAQNIARTIAVEPDTIASVHAVEEFWPDFGVWGERMRGAAIMKNADETSAAFEAILSEIDERTVRGNRNHPDWIRPVAAVSKFLSEQQPDHVIATKGIIARLAAAARMHAGGLFSLTNWVTNSGLIRLRCHRATMADRHLVPLPEDRDYLIREWNVRPRNISVIGPVARLSKSYGEPIAIGDQLDARRTLLYFNVVTHQTLDQLEYLLSRDANVECVALHSYAEADTQNRLHRLEASYPNRFSARGELSQDNFHKLFGWLKQAKSHLFVAKSGPNTMFEAMLLRLPMMLYRSGLPQEDWVLSYLDDRGVGIPNTEMRDLAMLIIDVLNDPQRQQIIVQCQQAENARLEQLSDLRPSQFTNWVGTRSIAV
jgi:hypothetical protein